MNGIAVINAPDGRPSVLTIDLDNLDPAVSPLVNAILALIEQHPPQPADYEFAATVEEERAEWQSLAYAALNRAYGDDEPDYTDAHLIERNPNYRPK